MANTYLNKTLGTSTNTYKGTVSVWFKKCQGYGVTDQVIYGNYTSSTQRAKLVLAGDGKLLYYQNDGGSVTIKLETSRLFRDFSAWYHVVLSVDTTQASSSDRVKLYVNGVQETAFDTATYPSQNTVFYLNANSVTNYVGQEGNSGAYWDGSMSHLNVVDGTAYTSSSFGSTDSTTGEWTINISPSVTYGNNGFFILKDSNSVTDQSGNSNNWTVGGGTLTSTEDCPDNNFATLNILVRTVNGTFSQGNNTFTDASGNYNTSFSTIGMFNGQGKYYAEFKVVSGTSLIFGIADHKSAGVIQRTEAGENRYLGEYANSYGYQRSGTFYYSGSSTGTNYDSFTTNDIIGMAVDMDNLKIYWHKNGTYQGAADPASNNGYTIVAPEGAYHMAISVASSVANANFGNGVFGTTSISSEGTNASAIGKFEYDVPTGYTALSTKGLNE